MARTLQTPESKLSLTERHENHGRVLSRRVSDLTSSSRFTQVAGCHQTERGDKVWKQGHQKGGCCSYPGEDGCGSGLRGNSGVGLYWEGRADKIC